MTDPQPSVDPWQRNVEVFPARLRTQTPHLLVITVFVLVGLTVAVLADRPAVALLIAVLTLVAAGVMAAFVALPFLRDTLFVSDGGLVHTNGTWMVQVPWDALCCVRRLDDLWEHRSLLHFRIQPVQAMPPRGPIKEALAMNVMIFRTHLLIQATVFGAEPDAGRFGTLLAQHRPDLVPTEPPPVSKRWRRCPHQLPAGAHELKRTWLTRVRSAGPIATVALALFFVGGALRSPLMLVAGVLLLVASLMVIGMQTARWVLTVSPDGLSEEFASSAAMTVPWSDVQAIRRVRHGLWPLARWTAEFAPRAAAPLDPSVPMPAPAVAQLLRRTGGRRIILEDYDLRPDAEPLRSILAAERPDLLPPGS